MIRSRSFLLAAAVVTCSVTLAADVSYAQPPHSRDVEPIDADVPEGHTPQSPAPGFFSHVAVDRSDGRYRGGDTLSVTFRAERDAHLYLLYHQADGTCVMVFPNKARSDNRVKAKQDVSIPARGEEFRFRIGPPFGDENLQVLAAETPIPELADLDLSLGRAIPVQTERLAKISARMSQSPGEYSEHFVVIRSQLGEQPLPRPKPEARAGLFIAVNKFQNPNGQEAETESCRKGAKTMHALMTKHGGVPKERAKLLIGRESTKAAIQEAITQWLPEVTQPGDTVFIYYCGHGGRLATGNPIEPDLMDEYLTAYDSDPTKQSGDPLQRAVKAYIFDDTLARWLQSLPGRRVVLILETCHSGGAIDSASWMFHDEAGRLHDISRLNTIVITTSLADELTRYDPIADLPIFPQVLERSISQLKRPTTVRAAFAFYRRSLPAELTKVRKKIQAAIDKEIAAGKIKALIEADRAMHEPQMLHSTVLPVVMFPKNP